MQISRAWWFSSKTNDYSYIKSSYNSFLLCNDIIMYSDSRLEKAEETKSVMIFILFAFLLGENHNQRWPGHKYKNKSKYFLCEDN